MKNFFYTSLLLAASFCTHGVHAQTCGTELSEAVLYGMEADEVVSIDLSTAIYQALLCNETLTARYWDRENELYSLKVSENEFSPKGGISIGGNFTDKHTRDNFYNRTFTITGPSATIVQQLPTAGKIQFSWANSSSWTKNSAGASNSSASTSLGLGFTQPLLRGGGWDIGTLKLTSAYLGEESNKLSLKSSVISTVNQVISDYRAYIQALERFRIDKRSIERSRKELDRTIALVEVGRRPELDLIQGKARLAEEELRFEGNIDSKDNARIRLLRTMNMDTTIPLCPSENLDEVITEEILPSVEEATKIAFENEPSYLQQLIGIRNSELGLLAAKNNLLWNLNLNGSVGSSSTSNASSLARSNQEAWEFKDRSWSVGLSLDIPVNDLSRSQGYIAARIGLRKACLSLQKTQKDISSDLKDRIRTIKSLIKRTELAKTNTELARIQLEKELVRLQSGKTTTFDYSQVEDSLIRAENSELETKIQLQNALTDFDRALGTTLVTWQIDVNCRGVTLPAKLKNPYRRLAHNLN